MWVWKKHRIPNPKSVSATTHITGHFHIASSVSDGIQIQQRAPPQAWKVRGRDFSTNQICMTRWIRNKAKNFKKLMVGPYIFIIICEIFFPMSAMALKIFCLFNYVEKKLFRIAFMYNLKGLGRFFWIFFIFTLFKSGFCSVLKRCRRRRLSTKWRFQAFFSDPL